METMNNEQILADMVGKQAVVDYLTSKYQNALKRVYDTDHLSKTSKCDFVVEYSNDFINFVEVKTRDVVSGLYQKTRIDAAKVDALWNLKCNVASSKSFIYILFIDGFLYRIDLDAFYGKIEPELHSVRGSKLGRGNDMTSKFVYDIDLEKYGECLGIFDLNLRDVERKYYDYGIK